MLINGQVGHSVCANDRALLYGDGLFETIAVRMGRPTLWQAHMQRLEQSARRLGIPCDVSRIEQECQHLLHDQRGDAVLKVLLSRGSGGRGYSPPEEPDATRILQLHPFPTVYDELKEQGIDLQLCEHPVSVNPALAGLKHLNRLDQVMASRELLPSCTEGLMCDPAGRLIEGTKSNVFLVLDGRLHTPALDEAGVAGIMRQYILERCDAQGQPCVVTGLRRDQLESASEVFVCNSVFGVLPALSLYRRDGQQSLQWPPGPLTRTMQDWIREQTGI